MNMIRKLQGKKAKHLVVPYGIAKFIVPAYEFFASRILKEPPIFTPYSLRTLQTNGFFSHEKATKEFGYRPRGVEETVKASLESLQGL